MHPNTSMNLRCTSKKQILAISKLSKSTKKTSYSSFNKLLKIQKESGEEVESKVTISINSRVDNVKSSEYQIKSLLSNYY